MKASKIIVGKGENVGNQHFFPFPTMFSFKLCQNKFQYLNHLYFVVCKMLSIWAKSMIFSFGKELSALVPEHGPVLHI